MAEHCPTESILLQLHPQQLYSDSALYELFKIIHPYSSEVVEALEDNGLGSKIELFNAIRHNLSWIHGTKRLKLESFSYQ